MPQKSEYKVITATSPAGLQQELNIHAQSGWKPIFMSSAAISAGVVTTVILEHVLGT